MTNVGRPAQFKRVMGTLAPYLGDNFDPHASVRTTVLGAHFKTGLALLTLDILVRNMGGADAFKKALDVPVDDARGIVERSVEIKKEFINVDCPLLTMKTEEIKKSSFAKILRKAVSN